MIEAELTVHNPNVVLEFTQQMFPLEVHQSMTDRGDYEVFRKGIHGAIEGLYSYYEFGKRLHATRKEIDRQDGQIRNLEHKLTEGKEKAENEARKAKLAEIKVAGSTSKDIITQCLMDNAIVDRGYGCRFC